MKITVEVQETRCIRCGTSAPTQCLGYRQTPVGLVPASPQRPEGWGGSPSEPGNILKGLCPACAAATEKFIATPEEPPVPREPVPLIAGKQSDIPTTPKAPVNIDIPRAAPTPSAVESIMTQGAPPPVIYEAPRARAPAAVQRFIGPPPPVAKPIQPVITALPIAPPTRVIAAPVGTPAGLGIAQKIATVRGIPAAKVVATPLKAPVTSTAGAIQKTVIKESDLPPESRPGRRP